MEDFEDIEVQEKLHIIISVKDFRSVLQHAQTTSSQLSSCYSSPGRPMKLSYSADGFQCEFILMTVGEKDANVQRGNRARANAAKATPKPGLEQASTRETSMTAAAKPSQTAAASTPRTLQQRLLASRPRPSQFEIRPEALPTPTTLRSESLFVTQNGDDNLWEPVNPNEDEDEDDNARLEWDASARPVCAREVSCRKHSVFHG